MPRHSERSWRLALVLARTRRAAAKPRMATASSHAVGFQPLTRFRISRLLLLLSIFAFVLNFEDSGVYSVIAAIQHDFHLSDFGASLIPTIEATGVVVTALPFALLADRISRKWIITIGLLLWGVFTAVSGLAAGILTLYIARAVMGLSMSGYDPSAQSALNDGYPPEQRSKALAVQNTAENVGLVVGVLIEALLVSFLSWRSVFFVISVLAFAAVLLAWRALRDPVRGYYDTRPLAPPADLTIGQALGQGFRAVRQEWRFIFGSFAQMIALFGRTAQQCAFLAISFFLSLFYVGYFGLDVSTAALMVVIFNGAGLFGALLSGWIDRTFEGRFSRGAHFVVAGGSVTFCGVLFFVSLGVPVLWVSILCLVFAGLGMGGALPPLSTAIGDVNGANRRAFAYSAQIIPAWFISALVPPVIGAVADTLSSLKVSLMAFAALLVVAGLVMVFSYPRLNKEVTAFRGTVPVPTQDAGLSS